MRETGDTMKAVSAYCAECDSEYCTHFTSGSLAIKGLPSEPQYNGNGSTPALPLSEVLPDDLDTQSPASVPTTWTPVDMGEALEGKGVEPPTMWKRTDNRCFIYSGRVHWFQGESESCKSWAAQAIAADELKVGSGVLYIDYEDDERGIVVRLRSLGVPDSATRDNLVYIRPDEALDGIAEEEFDRAIAERSFSLVIIDGVTESMTVEGLEIVSNSDVARWIRMLPKRLSRLDGAAVICIDHVTKSTEGQGRYAIGGQHKLAGTTGAAYRFTTVRPLSRPSGAEPTHGLFDVRVMKDRPGYVRGHTLGDKIGTFRVESFPDDTVVAALWPAGDTGPEYRLVTETLAYLNDYDGSSKKAVEEGVEAKAERIREALRWMVSDERAWLRIEVKGQSHLHWLTEAGRVELERRTK
jgi:hypothetical protein